MCKHSVSFRSAGAADPDAVAAADLNGDGLLDSVSASCLGDTLAIFFRYAPGLFSSSPDRTLGNSTTTNRPYALVAADLDGDGSSTWSRRTTSATL